MLLNSISLYGYMTVGLSILQLKELGNVYSILGAILNLIELMVITQPLGPLIL